MKANKFTVSITVECLSMDSVPALIENVIRQIRDEKVSGSFDYSDGDLVSWDIFSEPVEF